VKEKVKGERSKVKGERSKVKGNPYLGTSFTFDLSPFTLL